jgi:two-component system KDP operon response regulator KdpE
MPSVLIVEDHKVTLESLCLILERNGYKCLTAPNAEEAMRLFSMGPVDVVLMDYGLPDHDGGRLAANFKATASHIPIVMISGAGDLEGKPQAVDVLFAKPTDPALLLKTIRDLLG